MSNFGKPKHSKRRSASTPGPKPKHLAPGVQLRAVWAYLTQDELDTVLNNLTAEERAQTLLARARAREAVNVQ